MATTHVRILKSFSDSRGGPTLNPKKIVDAPADIADDWIAHGQAELAPKNLPADFEWKLRKLRPYEVENAARMAAKYGQRTPSVVRRPEATIEALTLTLNLSGRIANAKLIQQRLETFYRDRPEVLQAHQAVLDALESAQRALSGSLQAFPFEYDPRRAARVVA